MRHHNIEQHDIVDLGFLEVEHIRAVLVHTVEKLALIGTIRLDVQTEMEELTSSVGEGIYALIQKQHQLESELDNLLLSRPQVNDNQQNSKMNEISEAIRHSTRQLCRNLRDNPNIADSMAKVGRVRQFIIHLFNKGLTELQTERNVHCLSEALTDYENAEIQTKETIAHEKMISSSVRDLKHNLREEKIQHEIQIQELKKANTLLKEKLKSMKLETTSERNLMHKQCVADDEYINRQECKELNHLEDDISLLKSRKEMERNRHTSVVQHLHKTIQESEINMEKWIEQMKDTLNLKSIEIKNGVLKKDQEVARLLDIEEKIKDELCTRHIRESEERNRLEEENRLATMQETAQRAALKIQALWKGWKVRTSTRKPKPSSKRKGRK